MGAVDCSYKYKSLSLLFKADEMLDTEDEEVIFDEVSELDDVEASEALFFFIFVGLRLGLVAAKVVDIIGEFLERLLCDDFLSSIHKPLDSDWLDDDSESDDVSDENIDSSFVSERNSSFSKHENICWIERNCRKILWDLQ